VPNAALLGGSAALTGADPIESVVAAIGDRFPGPVSHGSQRNGWCPERI
jgi:hypothetical protein